MTKPHHHVVIAGDVDHGKSTLIGRLLLDTNSLPDNKLQEIQNICRQFGQTTELAYLIDQLKEERDNNMTIDTAQTFLKTPRANYTLIDAPGHTEFLQNMLTGAAQANAAILIIDINLTITQQTLRHAYLLNMLGIKNLFIVLNKIDLAEYKEDLFIEQTRNIYKVLKPLNIIPTNIIPVSAKEGINIKINSKRTRWYKGLTLLQTLTTIKTITSQLALPLRMPVQDIYHVDGNPIVVGQITSGQISSGQKVIVAPSLRPNQVISIKRFGHSPLQANCGENIGIQLADLSMIKRGCVICDTKNIPMSTKSFSGEVFWLGLNPLKINAKVSITCATQTINGQVDNIQNTKDPSSMQLVQKNSDQLHTHELATVSFAMEELLVCEKTGAMDSLGRFVVTQGARLLGAGVFN